MNREAFLERYILNISRLGVYVSLSLIVVFLGAIVTCGISNLTQTLLSGSVVFGVSVYCIFNLHQVKRRQNKKAFFARFGAAAGYLAYRLRSAIDSLLPALFGHPSMAEAQDSNVEDFFRWKVKASTT